MTDTCCSQKSVRLYAGVRLKQLFFMRTSPWFNRFRKKKCVGFRQIIHVRCIYTFCYSIHLLLLIIILNRFTSKIHPSEIALSKTDYMTLKCFSFHGIYRDRGAFLTLGGGEGCSMTSNPRSGRVKAGGGSGGCKLPQEGLECSTRKFRKFLILEAPKDRYWASLYSNPRNWR